MLLQTLARFADQLAAQSAAISRTAIRAVSSNAPLGYGAPHAPAKSTLLTNFATRVASPKRTGCSRYRKCAPLFVLSVTCAPARFKFSRCCACIAGCVTAGAPAATYPAQREAYAAECDTAVARPGPFFTRPFRLLVARAARVVYVVRVACPSHAVFKSRSELAVGALSLAVCESRSKPDVGAPVRTAYLSPFVERIFCCVVIIAFTVFADRTARRKYCICAGCAAAGYDISASCARGTRYCADCNTCADRAAPTRGCCHAASC